jgi:hypothetical protein
MKPLENNEYDYKIDILFGEIASILVVTFGFFMTWRGAVGKNICVSLVFLVVFILVPGLYLSALNTYNDKLAKWTFRAWTFCILLLALSVTNRLLNDFSGFWKVILPFAFVTVCMVVGLKGVVRIKTPNRFKVDQSIKVPESQRNLRTLIDSVDIVVALISMFTLMVLIGKYFHDFVLTNWRSVERHRALLFYAGMGIAYYPSKILAAAISGIFTVAVNLAWKRWANVDPP